MATTRESFDGSTEECTGCGRTTLHRVSVQMRTDGTGGDAGSISREPYRVAECQRCGTRSSEPLTPE